MKKCPHCAEEIQDEARICRHCNRSLRSKRGLYKWLFVIAALISVMVIARVGKDVPVSSAPKATALPAETKKLIASFCLEVNDQISDLFQDHTIGESIDKQKVFVDIFRKRRADFIVELSNVHAVGYKDFLNELLSLSDNSLAIAEGLLKTANYQLHVVQSEDAISNGLNQIEGLERLDSYGYNKAAISQRQEQIREARDDIERKKKMIETLNAERSVLLRERGETLGRVEYYLEVYGIDYNSVFPFIARARAEMERASELASTEKKAEK